MGKTPKKPLKVSKLSGGGDSVPDVKDVKIEPKVEAPATPDAPIPKPEIKSPGKVISPLLSEPVEVKQHAMGLGPQSGSGTPQPQSSLDNLNVDGDFFSTKPVQNPTLTKADLSEVNKDMPSQGGPGANPPLKPMNPDAPEMKFNPNPGPDQISVPDDVSRQAASELCDMIMSMYERLVPEGAHDYTKINNKEIKKLEASGDLLAGSNDLVVEENKENKKNLEKRAHEDAAMIKKPLKKLLEVKNISAPPHIELLIILVFVGLTYFMLIKSIKKSNDELLAKLYEKINKEKFGTGAVKDPDSEIPLAQTETVVK